MALTFHGQSQGKCSELLSVPLTIHGQSEAKCSELLSVALTIHGQSQGKCSELLSVPLTIHGQSEAECSRLPHTKQAGFSLATSADSLVAISSVSHLMDGQSATFSLN